MHDSLSTRPSGPAVILFATILMLTAATLPGEPAEPEQAPPAEQASVLTPEEKRLLEIEAMTESFESALHDLAARLVDKGAAGLEESLALRLTARPFPTGAGRAKAEHGWLQRHAWTPGGEPAEMERSALVASLGSFLKRYGKLENVTFELSRSMTDNDDTLKGELNFELRGRNQQSQREWIRGLAQVKAKQVEETWQITALELAELESLAATRELFHDVTDAAGVPATDLPLRAAMDQRKQWYPNAGAAADVDQDGWTDLLVTGPETNFLYLNQGDGTFRDGAAAAGLKTLLPGKAEFTPAFFDFDNDGDLDLFLTTFAENLLLENRLVPDGALTFNDLSFSLPQDPEVQSWSVAVADVNGDSYPDVYLPSYFTPLKGPFPLTGMGDTNGRRNLFYLNQGDGSFEEVGENWGVADTRFGMAAQFADVDGDHDPDLYVTNDYGAGNSLYINHGDRFVDEAEARGAVVNGQSMGISFADYDNDGDLDLHVTNMSSTSARRFLSRLDPEALLRKDFLEQQWSGNSLLRNEGDGTFHDVSAEAGPFLAEWGWGGGFLDIDNDGWEDLFTPNGFLSGAKPHDARGAVFSRMILGLQRERQEDLLAVAQPGLAVMGQWTFKGASMAGWSHDRTYVNRGDGTFNDVSGISGLDTYPSDARSVVYADFDNDGDDDVFVRALHGRAHFLFRNEVGQDNAFLRVALEGRESGRDAFGAVVRVKTEIRTMTKARRGSNGYLAQSDPRLLFGLGGAGVVQEIEVRWPSGKLQRFAGPPPGDSLLIVEGEEAPRVVEEKRFRLGG